MYRVFEIDRRTTCLGPGQPAMPVAVTHPRYSGLGKLRAKAASEPHRLVLPACQPVSLPALSGAAWRPDLSTMRRWPIDQPQSRYGLVKLVLLAPFPGKGKLVDPCEGLVQDANLTTPFAFE